MYCLTANPRSILMWTHYADNHRGICLEYGCGKSEFGIAVKVVYTDEYPLWRPHQLGEILDILITKSNVWAYEEEYRLVIPRTAVEHYPCRADDGDFMTLAPNTLKSIIVGMDGNYDAVAHLARRYAPGLPVNFITQNRSKFELALFQGKHQG
jgi:hypothetical protein